MTPFVKFNFVMYKFLKEQLLYVETYPVAIFLKCSNVQNAEEKFLSFILKHVQIQDPHSSCKCNNWHVWEERVHVASKP